MAEVTTYKCDVCGTLKREANHWFRAEVDGPHFTIVPWNGGLTEINQVLHLCGMECACKAMTEAMRGRS